VADARDRGVAIRDATTFRGLDSHVRVAVRRPAENDRLLAALGVGDGTATDPSEADDVFEAAVRDGVLRLRRPETRWLSTGWNGGRLRADAAYNVSVPEGFDRTDLGAYRDERLARAGFKSEEDPPTLFTGVSMVHAYGARLGSVVAYATVGLSNPAMLPMDPTGVTGATDDAGDSGPAPRRRPGNRPGDPVRSTW